MANDITTNTFVDGNVAAADEVNTNFDDLAQMKNANACAYQNGTSGTAQQSISTGTATEVDLDAEEFDPGGNFDTANNKYEAPITGIYHIDAALTWLTINSTKEGTLRIKKNGTTIVTDNKPSVKANQVVYNKIGKAVSLTAGDEITLECQHNNGITEHVTAGSIFTYLSIILVST